MIVSNYICNNSVKNTKITMSNCIEIFHMIDIEIYSFFRAVLIKSICKFILKFKRKLQNIVLRFIFSRNFSL